MKLAAKFARQETEAARVARIARRRFSKDSEEAVRRLLDIPEQTAALEKRSPGAPVNGGFECVECSRVFKLPMHWGRHRRSKHSGID